MRWLNFAACFAAGDGRSAHQSQREQGSQDEQGRGGVVGGEGLEGNGRGAGGEGPIKTSKQVGVCLAIGAIVSSMELVFDSFALEC